MRYYLTFVFAILTGLFWDHISSRSQYIISSLVFTDYQAGKEHKTSVPPPLIAVNLQYFAGPLFCVLPDGREKFP
jgi:hypothetical protein